LATTTLNTSQSAFLVPLSSASKFLPFIKFLIRGPMMIRLLILGLLICGNFSCRYWNAFVSWPVAFTQVWYVMEVKVLSLNVLVIHFWCSFVKVKISRVWAIILQNCDSLLCDCPIHKKGNRT
jgi:hypothetical protein